MGRLASLLLTFQAGVIACHIYHQEVSAEVSDPAHIAGIYSDSRYIEEAGDVIGTEIEIIFSGGAYRGTVQIAEGVPGTPIPISIHVSGKKISFSISDPSPFAGQFRGEIKRGVLKGKFSFKNGAMETVRLPKKSDQNQK